MKIWATSMTVRRSKLSASAPAASENSMIGSVVAACTSATMVGRAGDRGHQPGGADGLDDGAEVRQRDPHPHFAVARDRERGERRGGVGHGVDPATSFRPGPLAPAPGQGRRAGKARDGFAANLVAGCTFPMTSGFQVLSRQKANRVSSNRFAYASAAARATGIDRPCHPRDGAGTCGSAGDDGAGEGPVDLRHLRGMECEHDLQALARSRRLAKWIDSSICGSTLAAGEHPGIGPCPLSTRRSWASRKSPMAGSRWKRTTTASWRCDPLAAIAEEAVGTVEHTAVGRQRELAFMPDAEAGDIAVMAGHEALHAVACRCARTARCAGRPPAACRRIADAAAMAKRAEEVSLSVAVECAAVARASGLNSSAP